MTGDVLQHNATEADPLMTPEQIADYIRVSPETVRRYLRKGVLQGVRVDTGGRRGGNWRAYRSEVRRWLGMPESGVA